MTGCNIVGNQPPVWVSPLSPLHPMYELYFLFARNLLLVPSQQYLRPGQGCPAGASVAPLTPEAIEGYRNK